MKKRTFMSGVAFAALAGAISAAPAYASDGADVGPVDDEAAEAQSAEKDDDTPSFVERTVAPAGTFTGVTGDPFIATFDFSTLGNQRNEEILVGTISQPDAEIVVRADVGLPASVDVGNTQPSVVQIFSQRNSDGGVFFNCTGTVINARTILTAAHCLNALSSEAYGLPETGAERTMLIGTDVDTFPRLINYLNTGNGLADGGLASSTDVIIHPSANLDNGGLPFPWADVALIAVDAPITNVPAMPLLFTPLTELTHVVQVGYGSFGTSDTGPNNIGFLRRVGENMLGAIASPANLLDTVFDSNAPTAFSFGAATQTVYFTDFDNPDRTQEEIDGCTFFETGGISCNSLAAVRAIDWFEDDATPNEVATAGGDSGSPLIVDELYDFPVIAGVLSGGFAFFDIPEGYGDISFYNPLYPFFQFITENTPYKYVSAVGGDGLWSDPNHWTQDLDPGFFIDDGTGTLVNGIPDGEEEGVYTQGPNLGTIIGDDAALMDSGPSPLLPPVGTEGFGGNLPESSVLLGPGSTGFVPNNTDGTPGTAFENPAQYFEVHLTRAGTTTVDMDVEIDRLVIDNDDAGFVLGSGQSFASLIDVEHLRGYSEINGDLTTPIYTLATGVLAGDGGVINANALFNVNGVIDAGSDTAFGTLTIDGDYVQTSGGVLLADFSVGRRRQVSNDFYDISGTAVLDGLLVLTSDDRRVRFGTEFSILSAGAIDGDFSDTLSLLNSVILQAEHRIEGNEVIVRITARSIRDIIGARNSMVSLADTLDAIRGDRFTSFTGLFDVVDNATIATFGDTLFSLAPTSAFAQNFTANAFSQRFTGQVAQRTLALRGGSRGAGGFTAAGNASFALAGGAPVQPGQIGIFGSASGMYLNGGQQASVIEPGAAGHANAFEQLSLTQSGEITLGADMRVSDGFAFGVAVSNIRSSQVDTSLFQPEADKSTSVAIYASYEAGGMFADGYAGTADQRLASSRASGGDFAALYDSAVGQSDGEQVFGGLRLGYAFEPAKGFEVGPVVSMDYVRNSIGGFDEIGAGEFSLAIADRTFTSLGAKVGGMASVDLPVGETGSIRAFGAVAYAREMADSADVVTAHFFGAEDLPFAIRNELDPEWVSVNAGAEIELGANLRAALSVTSDMGRGPLSNEQAQATVSWRF